MVYARGLTRRFGDVMALHELDLEVWPGEVFGFLGPNGAGKTTAIKLLLGLLRPSAGEVCLFGEPLEDAPSRLLRKVGAVVEAPAFYPFLSGRDNLDLLRRMGGLAPARVDEVLELSGMQEASARRFGSYSVGMKQRLGLAAALLRDPELLILDEPTTGLDPDGQKAFCDLIPSLAAAGHTIFLSSHTLPEVQQLCHRVGILNGGRMVLSGPIDALVRGDPTVEVQVPDPALAAGVLANADWVRSVEVLEGRLVVRVVPGQSQAVNPTLAAAGIYATEIRLLERSLESVYQEAVHGVAA